jgi:rhodanese-related sulfurtransferase
VFKTRLPLLALILALVLVVSACGGSDEAATQNTPGQQVSGQIQDGLRVLTIDPKAQDQHFTIYRGDYVRAQLTTGEPFTIKIASLDVDKKFPPAEGEKPYFKVPDAGSYRFSVGEGRGVIEAINLAAASYREVSSSEAVEFIAKEKPVIVDVRTPGEFAGEHIEGAILIPVQEFQKRVSELAPHKNDPVFVYCRSGNRSTVAAKVLVDYGFTNVVNLRKGIVEWMRSGHPVVK